MSLPVLQTGEIWLFENDITNNPLEDDYLGPLLILDSEKIEDNIVGCNYEVIDLLTGNYTGVRVDDWNYKFWRQLA